MTSDQLCKCCPECGADDLPDALYCGRCGLNLTRSCPECGREDSIHTQYCITCGTDIPGLSNLNDILGRMQRMFGEKQWGPVLEAAALVPDGLQLPREKGRHAWAKFVQVRDEAQAKAAALEQARKDLKVALDREEITRAAGLAKQVLDLDPEDVKTQRLQLALPKRFQDQAVRVGLEKAARLESVEVWDEASEILRSLLEHYGHTVHRARIEEEMSRVGAGLATATYRAAQAKARLAENRGGLEEVEAVWVSFLERHGSAAEAAEAQEQLARCRARLESARTSAARAPFPEAASPSGGRVGRWLPWAGTVAVVLVILWTQRPWRPLDQQGAGKSPEPSVSIHANPTGAATVPARSSLVPTQTHMAPGVSFANSLGTMMIWVGPGEFLMGSPNGEANSGPEERQHTVRFTAGYWLADTELTQEQWMALMGNNPSQFQGAGEGRPVENVSWHDAVECCSKLTQQERRAGRLPDGYEYGLPTEAQWEYACRAGTAGPFAGDAGVMAWSADNSEATTHPVATRRPNAWGFHDLHGNVWEWCADWYGRYEIASASDPRGPGSGSLRVFRGGSWRSASDLCRSADRGRGVPGDRNPCLGFRPALSLVR